MAPTSKTFTSRVLNIAGFLLGGTATIVLATPPSLFYSLLELDRDQKSCLTAWRMPRGLGSQRHNRARARTTSRWSMRTSISAFNAGYRQNKSFATIVVAPRTSFDVRERRQCRRQDRSLRVSCRARHRDESRARKCQREACCNAPRNNDEALASDEREHGAGVAPSAIRMPISPVRCATPYDSTP